MKGYAIKFFAGTTGPFVKEHQSIASVKSWADSNNYVIGRPQENVPTFSVEHFDGSALSSEEIERLNCGEDQYQKRQPQFAQFSMYDGAIMSAIRNGKRKSA